MDSGFIAIGWRKAPTRWRRPGMTVLWDQPNLPDGQVSCTLDF
jgi:hypothetical protein